MDQKIQALLLLAVLSRILPIASENRQDIIGLNSLKLENIPPSWKGTDPCGTNWEGLECTNSSVTIIRLSNMGLRGQLTKDIEHLSELQILDLSNNKELTGQIPQSIGNLKKLTNLILVGCGFSGTIPGSIGSLSELYILALNSNHFDGPIPPSIGNLSKLHWLDLTDNNIEGPIPVSDGNTPGFDMLLQCWHFHLGKNKLSGPIPDKLFSSNMKLIHLLLDNNKLNGTIPSTLGLVRTLSVISMSNNSFEWSNFPSWFSNLRSLKTLAMDDAHLRGKIPTDLFSLPSLETVRLANNAFNGLLNIGNYYSNHLRLIDLQGNSITEFKNGSEVDNVEIILVGNPICRETGQTASYCKDSVSQSSSPYVTPKSCVPSPCSSNQISSPKCACAYPYTGTLSFIAPSFSHLGNTNYYKELETFITSFFQNHSFPVDSISLSNTAKSSSDYLDITLAIFPLSRDRFNRTEVLKIGPLINNMNFTIPESFGVFFFKGDAYVNYADSGIEVPTRANSKWPSSAMIGAAAGGLVLVLLLVLAAVYVFLRKRGAERTEQSKTFVCCSSRKSRRKLPQLKGARLFSLKELKKYTKNFSADNELGCGGYGMVYLGTLPTGELIAIKRAKAKTKQGELEFRTEIDLLSRVHHKNLVSLLGFCSEQGEQLLIYEYVPNGTLRDSLSGQSRITLNWTARLMVALGIAKGLAYLHELVDPAIIHRDIKSTNILLDDHLNAKVADFGLSKLLGDGEKDHVTTQVRGTAGYLDPEYYTTLQLTEKSDVYSFGVLMLELITGRKPIEMGKHLVNEVRATMDKTKDLYNLHTVVDPAIGLVTRIKGFERFVRLAIKCIKDAREDRPTMSEVAKEIEDILQHANPNPNVDSASTSVSYEESNETISSRPYREEFFSKVGIGKMELVFTFMHDIREPNLC